MVLGVGLDIVEVSRIRASQAKYGDRLLNRILRADETAYCLSHKDPAPFIAARFAAKEAISKAFGTGIGRRLGWQDIEVKRRESGQPCVVLHGSAQRLFKERGARSLHLSLSHTEQYAAAVAILED
jgi:holo-[acyl-carrier protein] synthase